MKIDFTQKLLNFEGKTLREATANDDGSRGPDRDLTLRAVSVGALNAVFQDERNIGVAEKDKRFELQLRLYREDVIDLDVDDISKIKELIGKMPYTPWVTGQARRMLDGKEVGITPFPEASKPKKEEVKESDEPEDLVESMDKENEAAK